MSRHGSLILHVGNSFVFPLAVVFSVFLLFAGHNAPGGGFVGGLVAGAAVTLRYADDGAAAVRRTVRVAPEVLLGTGLAIAGLVGAAGWIGGGELFESGKLSLDVPVLGTIKATSALPFDIGVYLAVVGVVVAALESLGGSADRDAASEGHATDADRPAPDRDEPGRTAPAGAAPRRPDTAGEPATEPGADPADAEPDVPPVHAGHGPNGPTANGEGSP